eukprot:3940728-Rhodomonas_salina.3
MFGTDPAAQVMCDYNLVGMGVIRLSSATFRAPDLRPDRNNQPLIPVADMHRLRSLWRAALDLDPLCVLNRLNP